jgi:hypothetical protein
VVFIEGVERLSAELSSLLLCAFFEKNSGFQGKIPTAGILQEPIRMPVPNFAS